ncbi:polyprenol phosphomannose-dependent alpha 1,6 mannosyltransferase MptB [Rhodococcus sp. X156]|uniref:polyprenol phosphomannose-dependent alpha 1,6 mannosyltransferase MptB n=1 Tax=Rhodococcus sp. X156 TaxID=2499145 RepID=UPI001F493FF2|nr:polyprenol phosphomannose-dependent alpha 1,6 mannosyltransferase MptB [Rhodococcus sp. X156]
MARLHDVEPPAAALSRAELAQLRAARRLGATGTVLMALGSLGAGANPVLQNPLQGVRLLGLPARMPATALAITITGMILVVLAWLVIGRFARGGAPRRMSRSQLDRTLLLWALPLTVAPPMFSKDVYSYLAQSEIAARGLDPYVLGPAQALGVSNVLTRTVPTIWRDTPAPYGPFFLWIGRGISSISRDSILTGIFLHRLLALVGVALIVWALPRLARRCGVAPVSALWLGALNPLVLFHLVSGIHNEALMIGLMLAGVELALRGVETAGPLRGRALLLLLAGSALVVLSAAVKVPSLLALGFVGMALARRWGASLRAVVAAGALLLGVTAAVFLLIGGLSGLGFGWTKTLGTANAVRSWMSMSTLSGMLTGLVGKLLGLGDHTSAILTYTRLIGSALATYVGARMLFAVLRGRLHAVGGLGITLGAVVLLFPVVHPWYLLWAAIPLAAWASAPAYRRVAVAVSAAVAVLLMPNGAEYPPFVIVEAAAAAVVVALVAMFLTRKVLPWREFLRPAALPGRPAAYAGTP